MQTGNLPKRLGEAGWSFLPHPHPHQDPGEVEIICLAELGSSENYTLKVEEETQRKSPLLYEGQVPAPSQLGALPENHYLWPKLGLLVFWVIISTQKTKPD